MTSIWGGRKETNQLKEKFPEEIDGDYWPKNPTKTNSPVV